MTEFENPYLEDREPSKGELAQEYASLFNMAALFFGLEFTDKEKDTFPIVVGAIMRERHKVDITKLLELVKRFVPQ